MKKITIWKDPYGVGYDLCDKRKVQIKEGVTVLVGCKMVKIV